MREIKFRAWNEVEGFLDTAWSIDFEHRLVCHRAHNQSDLDDCVLMQYTGLKGAKGVEIYEGDIVRGEHIDSDGVEKYMGVVMYFAPSFEIIGIKQHEGLSRELGHRCEVIGNIYENPELLEGE